MYKNLSLLSMQIRSLILICVLTIVPALLIPGKARASHAAGGELVYEWLADSTYKVIFKFYRDCGGALEPPAPTLCYRNTCDGQVYTSTMKKSELLPGGMPNGSSVSVGCSGYENSCLNLGSTIPGYAEWWYLDTVTLPARCSNWTFYTYVSQRNPSNNLQTAVFYVEAILNNELAQGNTSAYFSIKPVPYVCINQPYTFNNGAVDVDNDSLAFEVLLPKQFSGNVCSQYPANCILKGSNPSLGLPSNPFQTNNTFNLNTVTGALSFTPAEQGPQTVTIQAREYRNGVLIGSVMRDIQVQVLSCENSPPAVTPLFNTFVNAAWVNNQVQACASAPFSFCFAVISPDPESILRVADNHTAAVPGSVVAYSNQLNDSVKGCFSWTPSAADTGLRLLIVTVFDTTCLPPGILFTQSFTLPIYVWPGTRAAPDVFFDLPDEACIEQEITIEPSKKGRKLYLWETTPAVLVDKKDERLTLKWSGAGRHAVSLSTIPDAGCISLPFTDSILVRDHPHAEILGASDNNVCLGDTISVKALDMAAYSYQWQPSGAPADIRAVETVLRINSSIPVVLTVTDDLGCQASDSIYINARPCCDVFLPSAFTPNGDGRNDVFRTMNAAHSEVETFIVVNRFGETVFRTINIHKGWDGTFAGVPLDAGTYYYYIKYKCLDNRVYEKKGDVILVR